ncbi:hypothetical protein BDV25DRAFT_135695 [Aspergillus avenaceus]|uniref:Uncharacterized protein n=1 Tax=Aspergillus avenaceus TaxID=36643 RepID=A0A5N6U7G2_ASPAV|nr:hypothetical protein BDV25DRAFT_135695 [Aspergillus avenaceus]
MAESKSADPIFSPGTKSPTPRKTTAQRAHTITSRVLKTVLLCLITLPISYYLVCCHYLKREKTTCQGQVSKVQILLAGLVMVLYPLERILLYIALKNASMSNT